MLDLHDNLPAELLFSVPGLAAGAYRLEARTRTRNSADLKTATLASSATIA